MQLSDLPKHLIFLTLHGSHAYGTATPTSDYDIRGIGIGPLQGYFGTQPWEQLHGSDPFLVDKLKQRFPHAPDDLDSEIYNLTKFVRLAADSNPNILDVLFAHPDDWLVSSPSWDTLHRHRHLFLSMRVQHTYTGYAMSQLKRIQTHRRWLLSPPAKKPERADFQLPDTRSLVPKDIQDMVEALLKKKIDEWQLDSFAESMDDDQREDFRYALRSYFEMIHGRPMLSDGDHEREQAAIQIGLSGEIFSRIEAERRYRQALHEWKQYQTWLVQRNPARSALEAQFNYDTKHASHLVRLLLSAEEILTSGNLSVRHPHAELLRQIRQGAWTYDHLIAWATEQENTIASLASKKPLPRSPDRSTIDSLVTSLIMDFHRPPA